MPPTVFTGLPYSSLREMVKQGAKVDFPIHHARKVQHAIANKISQVTIEEKVNKDSDWVLTTKPGSTHNMSLNIDSRASYTIGTHFESIVSLDHLSDESLQAFGHVEDHIMHHCPTVESERLHVNTVLLGSNRLHARFPKPHTISNYFLQSQMTKQITGFSIMRRIVGKKELTTAQTEFRSASKCYEYQTEVMHPFELFDHFRIEQAVAHAPSLTAFVSQDAPLQSCVDYINSFSGGVSTQGNIAYGWDLLGSVCASYTNTLPGKLENNNCRS